MRVYSKAEYRDWGGFFSFFFPCALCGRNSEVTKAKRQGEEKHRLDCIFIFGKPRVGYTVSDVSGGRFSLVGALPLDAADPSDAPHPSSL